MSGKPIIGPFSITDEDAMVQLAAWLESIERRMDHAEAALVGPTRGWSWATDDQNQPAIIDGAGNLSSLSAVALAKVIERVTALERRVLGPVDGWTWEGFNGSTFAVRSPNGTLFEMALLSSSLPAPVVALGDSNTTNTLPALTRVPWFDLLWPPSAGVNLAVGGHGYTISGSTLLADADEIASGATVFLSAGIDDLQNGASQATVEAAIQSTVDSLNARGLDCVVCTLFPIAVGSVFSSGLWSTRNTQRVNINTWIKSTFTRKTARALNLAGAVEATADGALASTYDLGDGLHLNTLGQQAVATYARSILRV